MIIPLFGSLMLLNENELSDQELKELDNFLLYPVRRMVGISKYHFQQEYQKAYNKIPGIAASYAFDGMNILIEAIRNAGSPDREKIQKSLTNISMKVLPE